MIRGTTPLLEFGLPFSTDIIKEAWLTFSQFNKEVFTIEDEALTMEGSLISVKLTQEQTLLLSQNSALEIQIRILTNNGDALASNIIRTDVGRILKDGEIHE